jgi:hypothetical protein
VKRKAILTSLIVSSAVVILVGYFVGCGQPEALRKAPRAQQAAQEQPAPAEDVAFADVEPTAEPAPAPAEPSEQPASAPTGPDAVTDDAKSELMKTRVSAAAPKDEVTYARNWREIASRRREEDGALSDASPQSGVPVVVDKQEFVDGLSREIPGRA